MPFLMPKLFKCFREINPFHLNKSKLSNMHVLKVVSKDYREYGQYLHTFQSLESVLKRTNLTNFINKFKKGHTTKY